MSKESRKVDNIVRFSKLLCTAPRALWPKNMDDALEVLVDTHGLFTRNGDGFEPVGAVKQLPKGPLYVHFDLGKRLVTNPDLGKNTVEIIREELDRLGRGLSRQRWPKGFETHYDPAKGDLYVCMQPLIDESLAVPNPARRSAMLRIAGGLVGAGFAADGTRRLLRAAESIRQTSPLALELQAREQRETGKTPSYSRGEVTITNKSGDKVTVERPASDPEILGHTVEAVAGALTVGVLCGSNFIDGHWGEFSKSLYENFGLGGALAQQVAQAKEHSQRATIRHPASPAR